MSDQSNAIEEVRLLFRSIVTNGSNSEPIFVSFDVAHGNLKAGLSAIGTSILDSRHLKRCTTAVKDHDHPLFWTFTYNFQHSTLSLNNARERSLFDGNAQKVSNRERIALLRHIFFYPEEEQEDGAPRCCHSHKFRPFRSSQGSLSPDKGEEQGRPIIAVGHSVNCDIRSLRRAGFSIEKFAPVLAFLDTQKIARELFWKDDASKNVSLRNLGFKPAKLHICGNDAGYTLILLLGPVSRILGSKQEGEGADTDAEIRRTLEQLVEMGLASAKTSRQKWKETLRRDGREVDDWAEYLDGEELALTERPEDTYNPCG